MTAYYNEIEPFAAQWLRNLIAAGLIADGVVDERSIEDVRPSDLNGFTQCHFFAGIGVWSYALRRARWSDDRLVWTGSCPCQPFSAAGTGAGFDDERHLWPTFFHLIQECKPAIVFGEQVASKDANPWIDLVQTDLEAVGYRVGAVAFPAAGVGAPHIRDRLYWVGYASSPRLERHARNGGPAGRERQIGSIATPSISSGLADLHGERCGETRRSVLPPQRPERAECSVLDRGLANTGGERVRTEGLGTAATTPVGMCAADGQRERLWVDAGASSTNGADRLADANHDGHSGSPADSPESHCDGANLGVSDRGNPALEGQPATSPTNGYWRDADWLLCRDGKWRPVEPGTFPLVDGAPARVGRLRAYGNAINAKAAQVFIEAAMSYQP